jgi:hypothetical protein
MSATIYGEVKYMRDERPRYEGPSRHEGPSRPRFGMNVVYRFEAHRDERRPSEHPDIQIAELYDELAQLVQRRVAGDLDTDLERVIHEKFSQLRRLQQLQTTEIKARFRATEHVLVEDLRRLREADRLLRDRGNTAEPHDASD